MLIEHINDFLKIHKIKNILVGFSGGVDSTVLLYILSNFTDVNLRAIYVNHSMSKNSFYWNEFCLNFCNENNIEYIHEIVKVKKEKRKSTEAIARDKRYQSYDKHLKDGETLFLGQHSDDQVETVLLQLFRGTGVSGLSGMPSFSDYKKWTIARPFITETINNKMITKEDIEHFASDYNISHIVDESNFNNKYRRNFLRNEIIPKLKNEFGNINKTISKTALNCKKAKINSDKHIETMYFNCMAIYENSIFSLSTSKLKDYNENDMIEIIRFWMSKEYNQKSASLNKLKEIVKFLRNANNDNNFEIKWGENTLKFKNNILFVSN
jgi:tRNA(Ile)-lysidine synthase